MTKSIQFYYDFSSPYTYIAHKKIREIQKKNSIKFIYCPMLLGGLHKLAGITANAFIKNKNEFMRRDCEMVSKKLKIDFKFNDYFPISSLNLMRGSLVTNKDILDKYKIESEVIVSNVDEDQIKESLIAEKATPLLISKNLAELKSTTVSRKIPGFFY